MAREGGGRGGRVIATEARQDDKEKKQEREDNRDRGRQYMGEE